jgi:uncharacterized membrane protein YheB (UPF0754 family)
MPKNHTNLIRKPDFKIIYAIGAIGSWTPHDFRINFYSEKIPDENSESYVNDAQVILTPAAAKEFAVWLMQNVQDYEKTVGKELESNNIEIKTIDDKIAEIRKDIEKEIRDNLSKKIEKEIKNELKSELTKELENSVKTQLAKDLTSKPRTMKLKKVLKKDLQKDLQKDLKKDLKEDIKRDLAQDLKKDLKTAIPPAVQTELKKAAITAGGGKKTAKKADTKKVTRRRRTVKK